MRNKYNCISVVSITKAIIIAFLIMLPNALLAQQSPSIQTGVTFQWSDTQANISQPATIQSVTIDGTVYNTFVVPTSYEMTRLGPDGHFSNRIRQNGNNVGGNSNAANWVANATAAFQDKNLNHYFTSNQNGRGICGNFDAALATDAQKQTIFYSPAIPSNEGGVVAVTERGGNNCFYIEVWGTPPGGGPEQKLGETFIRNVGNYTGCNFAPPTAGSDYWQSGRCNENGQTIGVGLFYLDDITPTGSSITKIEFVAATTDHGDGKFFILQKYAVDQQNLNCIDTKYSDNVNKLNNVPSGSTYNLISGPTPAGQAFTFNTDGSYSYTPTDGYTGDVVFEYEVCLPAPNTTVCDTATVTINFVELPPTPEASVSCGSGNDDFTISVTSPLGEEFEYSINSEDYQSSPDFNDLPEGSYFISVRSTFTMCDNMNPVAVVLDNIELSGITTNVACKSENSGAVDITVAGGKSPYTYSWSNGATSEDLSDVIAGTYTVTITDANGCTISDSYTINEPSEALTSNISATTDALCNGESTGAIDLTISGGTAPYTVAWDNGSTTEDLSGIAAGNYNIIITDANGCTTTNQATINEPVEVLSANVANMSNADCNGDASGNITVEASGGTNPYQYSLDNGTTNQTSDLFENLAAGSYTILVTDANDCTTTVQATITEPNVLGVSITSVSDVDCAGEATGDITIDVTGGTEPYSYSWSNSDTTQNLNGVLAGSYTVNITDANGCTVTANATISEPANPLSINISKVDANTAQGCTNGEATADVTGGTAPYTYLWSASANNQTSATATNLPVGSHSVTVTDANGCQLTQSIVIVCVNTCDGEIQIGDITNVLCVGDATGSGTVSASSNANPNATFTFTWSNGQVDAGVTSSTLTNVTAGVYDVSVTIDGTVCQPIEETISITEPNNALNLTATSTDELGPNTNDGTASATATGGVEPYTYVWSPGGQTTQDISGLPSGTYTVTVTDANGCTDTATVSVNPGTCNNLSISGTSTPVVCNGESNGSVTAVVSNGVGPFTYSWDTLPDTTPSVSNLPAGSYTVTVLDQITLCTQTTTITVNEPNALSTGIAVTNILCKNDSTGSVDLTVNGGTSPYTYVWNTGATTEDLINVIAGTYSVTVTDANGCTTTNEATVLEPNEVISGSITQITNVECLGNNTGSITVEGAGGIPPYTYSIDNSATVQISGLFENLGAGDYTILIIDANGCTFNINGTVGIDDVESPEISVPPSITIEGCSTADISEGNSVFIFSDIQSGDVQTIFATNPDYNASDDSNIQSITYIDVVTSTDNCPITVLRTFTITDNCDNTVTATQTITIEDTIAPDLTSCTVENTTLECTDVNNETLADAWNAANIAALENCATDTCDTNFVGQVTSDYNFNNLNTTCGPCGTINVIYTVTDDCGNASTLAATLTFDDGTIPDLSNCTVTDETIECSGDDNEQLANDWNASNITALENCADDLGITVTSNYTFTDLASTCGQGGTIAVVYTITDDCGNATTLNATLTLEDTTPPNLENCSVTDTSIECSGDDNETLANDWNAANIAALETCGADTCDTDFNGQVTSDYVYTNLVTTCGQGGTIAVVYTITDDCGNATTLNATLTLEDTTPPNLDNCSVTDASIECSGDDNETLANDWNAANIAALETCGADTCDTDFNGQVTSDYVYTNLITTCGQGGTIAVVYTITDDCGNATTLNATLTLEDTTPPNLDNCSVTDTSIECSGDDNETLANDWNAANIAALETCGTDTCDTDFNGQVTSDFAFTNLETTCGQGGTIAVVYTITDDCGNATTLNATLTLEDTTPPNLDNCSVTNTSIECSGDDNETLANDWNAANIAALETCGADTCDTDFNGQVTSDFAFTNLETTCGLGGTISVIYTITDDCGNATTLDATLTIEDTTAPVFDVTLPTDATLECDTVPTAETITATDNCGDATVTVVETTTAGSCDNEYTLVRVWTATDACGNAIEHTQTLTVQDTTAPTFNETLPADTNAECDAVPTAETLTASDNCGDTTVTFVENITNGSCVGDYIIERTWTATDSCDNEVIHTQIITVQDTTAPTMVTPLDENVTADCDDIPVRPDLVFEDACSNNISVVFDEVSTQQNDFEDYQIIRTWTVTDDCGNVGEFTQTVSVQISNIINAFDSTRCILDIEFDLFDLLTGDFDMNGTWSVVSGDATINGSLFDPNSVELGLYTFMYSITDGPCPKEVEVNVTIDDDCVVLPCGEEDVVISKTVTANGDNFNEFFTISGVEDCGFVFELQIFNRWGAEIYKNNNYQNDWNGDSHGSSVGSSGKVPTGTYYYIINIRNSGLKPFAGPIYVATNK